MDLTALDSLACGRGDGLVPELRTLLESLNARRASGTVVELDARRPEPYIAAGTPPSGRTAHRLADDKNIAVLRFPAPHGTDDSHPTTAPLRRGS
jgi:hypothetical protein